MNSPFHGTLDINITKNELKVLEFLTEEWVKSEDLVSPTELKKQSVCVALCRLVIRGLAEKRLVSRKAGLNMWRKAKQNDSQPDD